MDQIIPTRWPLFELHLSIWKLHIKTALFCPEGEIGVYEYLMLVIVWAGKEKFRFRLFDVFTRMSERAALMQTKKIIDEQSTKKHLVN